MAGEQLRAEKNGVERDGNKPELGAEVTDQREGGFHLGAEQSDGAGSSVAAQQPTSVILNGTAVSYGI